MKKTLLLLIAIFYFPFIYSQVPEEYKTEFQSILEEFQGENSIPGISASVLIDGMGVWHGVSGDSHAGVPINTSMILGIGSNTKLFTSVMCLLLVENGILSLDDSLGTWINNYENIDPNIRIRQLLKHQSGVADFTQNSLLFTSVVIENPEKEWTPEEVLALVGPSQFEPGTKVSYSNTNYILVAMVIEAASGRNFEQMVRDSLLDPLGLEHTYFEGFESFEELTVHPWVFGSDYSNIPRTSLGTITWSAGSMISSPKDMVKWYDIVFKSNLISNASFEELTDFVDFEQEDYNMGMGIYELEYEGKIYWGHGGRTIGYSTWTIFDTDLLHSISVTMNETVADPEAVAIALASKLTELTDPGSDIEELPVNNLKIWCKIFPNPSDEYMNITVDDRFNQIYSVNIFDMYERNVYSVNNVYSSYVSIGTENFPDGFFTVIIATKKGNVVKKLMTSYN